MRGCCGGSINLFTVLIVGSSSRTLCEQSQFVHLIDIELMRICDRMRLISYTGRWGAGRG